MRKTRFFQSKSRRSIYSLSCSTVCRPAGHRPLRGDAVRVSTVGPCRTGPAHEYQGKGNHTEVKECKCAQWLCWQNASRSSQPKGTQPHGSSGHFPALPGPAPQPRLPASPLRNFLRQSWSSSLASCLPRAARLTFICFYQWQGLAAVWVGTRT